jgi:hypothetical protein
MNKFIKIALFAMQIVLLVACTRGGSSNIANAQSSGSTSSSIKASPVTDFNYVLTEDGKGVRISRYTGKGGAVIIPAEIEGYPVVELGTKVFYGEDNSSYGPGYNITSVVIPASVKKINKECFSWIENLKSVTIQGTGVELGQWAFTKNINLIELKIPDGDNVLIPSASYGAHAFYGCTKLPLAMRARLVAMGFTNSGF